MLSSIMKKTLMALSGLTLSGFIIAHALGNATTFFGKEVFLSYAQHLHSLGIFITLFEFFLLAFFSLHLILGIIVTWENFQARSTGYAVKKNAGGRTLGSRSMPYSGAIIFLFIFLHLKDFHFMAPDIPINEVVRNNLHIKGIALFYLVALIALILHMSHGFWSLFQSLGLNHPKYNLLLTKGTFVMSLFIGTIFILIPLFVQFCDTFLL